MHDRYPIACEEGILTRELLDANAAQGSEVPLITADGPAAFLARALTDLPARLAAMDRDGVDVQLLMLSAPGVQVFRPDEAMQLARSVNDELGQICRTYPSRFAALAAVPPQAGTRAVRELEREVTEIGLKGVVVNSHTDGRYLDDEEFLPLLEAIEALNVPLYIHPREAPPAIRQYMDNPVVAGAAWEYAVEAGTHLLRLIGSGVFDRLERLTVVVGHLGEGIPFWLPRIDNRYRASVHGGATTQLLPSEYVQRHVFITTSGMNYWEQLKLAIDVVGLDRVLYATDFPFENQTEAIKRVEDMPFDQEERHALFELNAARVFGI